MSSTAPSPQKPATTAPLDATGAVAPPLEGKTFFGHPRGLSTLFFTEMWERFSFYGMRALLMLFMTAAVAEGGLGFGAEKAGAIYGLYTSFVYLTALPGGWIADRLIGQRKAVLYGGIIIAAGHFVMAFPWVWAFYLGLFLIVMGTGLLKPNISTMVGDLYQGQDGAKRDAGFSIFYMGINLGAFFAPWVCGTLGEKVNWHLGFAAAGVGMVLGIIQYQLGGRNLGDAGLKPKAQATPSTAGASSGRNHTLVLVGALALLMGGLQALGVVDLTSAVGLARAMGIIIVSLAALFFINALTSKELEPAEKKRVGVIAILFVVSALFWAGFEQAGSSFSLFIDRLTDRTVFGWEIPASAFQSVNAAFIILFAPVFAWMWVRLSRKGREPSSPAKFSTGMVVLGLGFLVIMAGAQIASPENKVSMTWIVATFLLHTFAELTISPVGLSTVTKLAPHRQVGQMMGVWFMATSLGNLMAGLVAGQFEKLPPSGIFGALAAVAVGAGIVLFLVVRPIRRMMGGVH